LALGEEKMVGLEDPKWDSRLLGRLVHNVIHKDWDLVFLLAGWGLMALPNLVDEIGLPMVVPMIVRDFW
jgi:hypothetical protein